ncbi:Short-chain dehydrogenase reductase family 32C member 1 [Hyphodiscus hymeniophilus]|uniref:Short-chain dehydrogenase reductase family 32C member 1 n=1 Tax=Hyphodiscus hymeniophilus TaxID=353542 RepID=A0A9P6VI05_9HELO|nr:Short-chain dehydrogenase reductase family 32C member 1 [Hyphodiscus hymeniophilus]
MSFFVQNPWPMPVPDVPAPSPSVSASDSDMYWLNKSSLTKHTDTYPFIDPYRFQNTLRHKVVVVTLAHRGMGRATANAFAAAGASVVVVGPSAAALQPVMTDIKQKYGTPALALAADVLDPLAPARIVLLTEKHLGHVDILINISPSAYMRPFAQEKNIMSDWWPMVERTVRTPVAMINAVLPSMISRHTGIIITVTSVAGFLNIPFMSSEGVSKAAILKFHQHLHVETQPKGVTSFAVNPGLIPSYLHDPDEKIIMRPEDFTAEPRMEAHITSRVSEFEWDAAGLAAGTFVALCADPRSKILSGMFVNSERDLGEMIDAVERDPGRVERERLYTLKVDEL